MGATAPVAESPALLAIRKGEAEPCAMGHARKGVAGAGVNGKPGVAEASKGGRVTGNAGVAEASGGKGAVTNKAGVAEAPGHGGS
mgnify:CR=1 FL=1